jgi:hypothetical protein
MSDPDNKTGRSYANRRAPSNRRARAAITRAHWGIIEGFDIQPQKNAKTMEAERINAISALLSDLTSRESELRRYL